MLKEIMVTWNLILCILLATLLDCGISSNVSLTMSEETTCPSVPVTAQCTVKQPESADDLFLVWGCIGEDEMNNERLVFCDDEQVSKLICKFGDVYDIRGVFCDSNDGEKIIKSEATFKTTSMCDLTMFCSYGKNEAKYIPVSIQNLKTPKFSRTPNFSMINESVYEVTVFWSVDDCTRQEVEYILSVNSSLSSAPINYITNYTNMTLLLRRGIQYNLTVTAQLCDGNVTSNPSNLIISGTTTPTKSATKRGSSNVAVTASVPVAVVIVILGAGVFVFILAVIVKNRRINKRSGVAGLYVDDSYIYYSCTKKKKEYKDDAKKMYTVQRCTYDGTVVKSFSCDCFVRGIGLDNDGNVYILCSRADPYVLKLNRKFNIMKRTKSEDAEYFGEARGMMVTSEYVLVISEKCNQICVFDLELKFYHNFKPTSIEGLIAIAKFNDRYIVTGRGTIGMIDIDFKNKEIKGETSFKSMHRNDQIVYFDLNKRLRGICAIGNYIYVTQVDKSGKDSIRGLPIMCLHFDGERLNFLSEDSDISRHCTEECTEKCGSVVIFCHNNTIFYSQGSFGKLYHIIKATHNPGEAIESTKVFDVR